jgi:hypothetical protein
MKSLKLVCICLLYSIASQSLCLAKVVKLPIAARQILESSASVRQVIATKQLPQALVAMIRDRNGRLAEPGQKWEVRLKSWVVRCDRKTQFPNVIGVCP